MSEKCNLISWGVSYLGFVPTGEKRGIKSQLLRNPSDGHPGTMNLDILDYERSQKMKAKDSKAFWLPASHPNELLRI